MSLGSPPPDAVVRARTSSQGSLGSYQSQDRPSDPCDFSQVQGLSSTGDTFLLNTVAAILNSKSFTRNSVIFITWDESDFT